MKYSLKTIINAFRSGYDPPMDPVVPKMNDAEITREIVAHISRDNPFLQAGKYITQKQIDAERKEISFRN
ncbi:MAG: hypothetical protein Q8L27_05180 [archaeon]|nr:hypothetical protein [archaeon]